MKDIIIKTRESAEKRREERNRSQEHVKLITSARDKSGSMLVAVTTISK
jgi:hypothetical protein